MRIWCTQDIGKKRQNVDDGLSVTNSRLQEKRIIHPAQTADASCKWPSPASPPPHGAPTPNHLADMHSHYGMVTRKCRTRVSPKICAAKA